MNWNETEERPVWPQELEDPVAKLGSPSEVFTTSRRKAINKLLLGLALLVVGIGVNYVYFVLLGGPILIDKFLILLLFGTPIFGIGLMINSFRDRGMWVLVYPMGLLRWHKNEVLSFPWDEVRKIHLHRLSQCDDLQIEYDENNAIRSVALNLEGGSRFFGSYVVVHREDGSSAYFPSSLQDYTELANRIQRETFIRLWPALWEQFSGDQMVYFGELGIGRNGLYKNDDWLPWLTFGGAKVANGRLIISRLGKWRAWHDVAIQEVENPHLLMALLKAGQPLFNLPEPESAPPVSSGEKD